MKDYISNFLKYFSINGDPTDILEDLDGSDGTSSYSYDETNDKLKWYPSVEVDGKKLMEYVDTEYIIIASIGCASDNKPFCRIMKNINTNIINCVFRPFVLAGSEQLPKRDIVQKFLSSDDKGASNDISCNKTAAKLVWTMKKVFDRQPVGLDGKNYDINYNGILIKRGDYDMLVKWRYKTCIHNKNFLGNSGKAIGETVGMMQFIYNIITYSKPKGVIFSGFSLGGEMATAASILTAYNYPNINVGLVACCGEAATNEYGVNLAKTFKLSAASIVVAQDDVSGINKPWLQVGPTMVINYEGNPYGRTNRRIEIVQNYSIQKDPNQQFTLIIDQVFGDKVAGSIQGAIKGAASISSISSIMGITLNTGVLVPIVITGGLVGAAGGAIIGSGTKRDFNFKRLHLAAEETIPRILWESVLNEMPSNADQKKYFETFGIEIKTNVNNKLWCKWFTENNYANKNRICPSFMCKRIKTGENKFDCVYKGVDNINNPIGGINIGVKRIPGDIDNIVTKKQQLGVCPSFLRKWAGKDFDIVRVAEQSYITTMNDFKIKNEVVYDMTNNISNQINKPIKFIGSFLVTRELQYEYAVKNIGDHVMRIRDAASILHQYSKTNGLYVFLLGGLVFETGFIGKNILGRDDISHHLAFLWDSKNGNVISFNPGTGCWDPDMKKQSYETVLMGTGVDKINEDQIIKNGKGPQDILNTCFRGDSFCQTWAFFWICNYISGCSATKWPTDYSSMYVAIRKFILWELQRFKSVHTNANDIFHSHNNGKYKNKDILDVLASGWYAMEPSISVPSKNSCVFCN